MPLGNPGRVIFLNGTSRSTNGSMCGRAIWRSPEEAFPGSEHDLELALRPLRDLLRLDLAHHVEVDVVAARLEALEERVDPLVALGRDSDVHLALDLPEARLLLDDLLPQPGSRLAAAGVLDRVWHRSPVAVALPRTINQWPGGGERTPRKCR